MGLNSTIVFFELFLDKFNLSKIKYNLNKSIIDDNSICTLKQPKQYSGITL